MPEKSFRDYMEQLDEAGMVRRVEVEVDPDWEMGATMRRIFSGTAAAGRYAVRFENVKGCDFPAVIGATAPNRHAAAMALDAGPDPREMFSFIQEALNNPIAPQDVSREKAPCKENVLLGDDVDLCRLPIPVYSAGRDVGRYITSACNITRDPDTGEQNVGVYRAQVKGPRLTAFGAGYPDPGRNRGGLDHFYKWAAKGKAMPAAMVLGADPAVLMTAAYRAPLGFDELQVAGGMRREPISVVRCETSDVLVPANAEIVIEGEVPADERGPEGPIGEAAGFMHEQHPSRLVFRVNAITYRDGAVCQGLLAQMPPGEGAAFIGAFHDASIYRHLVEGHSIPGILDVAHLESSGNLHLVIKMEKPSYPGPQTHILNAAWTSLRGASTSGKIISVVDEDIDIHNLNQVLWAYAFRYDPAKDIQIVPGTPLTHHDMAAGPHDADYPRMTSRLLIDATKKYEYPEIALPVDEVMEKVVARWSEYGLPAVF